MHWGVRVTNTTTYVRGNKHYLEKPFVSPCFGDTINTTRTSCVHNNIQKYNLEWKKWLTIRRCKINTAETYRVEGKNQTLLWWEGAQHLRSDGVYNIGAGEPSPKRGDKR